MNVSRFVGGIILLAVATLLLVLNLVLPPDEIMFMIGDSNLPFVPVIVLAIVGIWLVATAWQREKTPGKAPEPVKVVASATPEKIALNQRLETVGWGLFLIMLGGFMLVPHAWVDKGIWSIGVGLIILGAYLLLKPWFDRRQLFGKAEEA